MIGFILRHNTGITYIVIVVILVSTVAAQVPAPKHPSLLAWIVYSVFSPVQQAVSYVFVGARDLWTDYVDLRDVREENELLRSELAKLQRENQNLREKISIVGGLQELEAFRRVFEQGYDQPSLSAMVIGAGVGDSSHVILLNRGELDGVEVNQGVICPRGAVGKVIRVGPTSCMVQTLVDPRFAMAARVQRTRVRGLAHGTGDVKCELRYIRDNDQVETGDLVVASGLEGIFPPGVLIGEVSSVLPGEPPFRRVDVAPGVELNRIEWVLIVKPKPKPDATPDEEEEVN